MKKTLLAAALTLGFAGVAQAETSVTLYGILDGGIGYQQVKGTKSYLADRDGIEGFKTKKTGMINGVQSGNRWGLKGVEDLGDGLRVVFQLESGFDLSTGDRAQGGRLFGRQATVGLAGDSWGQLDLGRQTNIASKYLPGVADPFGASFGQANMGAAFTAANTVRYDNMIMYQTPNFSGFQFGAGYSFNADGGQSFKNSGSDDPNARAITAGLRYANGPIGVALTYDQVKNPSSTGGFNFENAADAIIQSIIDGVDPLAPGNIDWADFDTTGQDSVTIKSWNIGGSYDFEVVKAYLAYGQTRNGFFAPESFGSQANPTAIAGRGMKVNSYLLGLSAPIGNGNLMASWHVADPRNGPDAWDDVGQPERELKKQHTYSLGYTYGLSKRTNVYAIGSYSKNIAFLPDGKSTVLGVGIRHQF